MDASLGISRRTLLRRGAAVGGLVWTAPVVHTLAAPAASAGTPVDGLSYVAVLVEYEGKYYRMKYDVDERKFDNGGNFATPSKPPRQLVAPGGAPIENGPLPGGNGFLAGNQVKFEAPNGSKLVDYMIKHGPCAVGPQGGQPSTGTTGPWTFSPLASPPVC